MCREVIYQVYETGQLLYVTHYDEFGFSIEKAFMQNDDYYEEGIYWIDNIEKVKTFYRYDHCPMIVPVSISRNFIEINMISIYEVI